MDTDAKEFDSKLEERFEQLPKVVQDAITSADVEQHLRELAQRHKLHLDQWEKLENEVMLALLGFQPAEDLEKNIKAQVGVDETTAAALTGDISTIVFQPIRQELERELSHPNAASKATTGVEDLRTQTLAHEAEDAAQAPMASGNTPAPMSAAPAAAPEASVPPSPAPTIAAVPGSPAAPVVPATPPAPAPEAKATREAVPSSYTSSASHERKTIEGDPYREQID